MIDTPEGLTDEELDTFALLKLAAQAVLKGDAVSADDKVPSVKIGAATLIRLVTVLHAERTKSRELEAELAEVDKGIASWDGTKSYDTRKGNIRNLIQVAMLAKERLGEIEASAAAMRGALEEVISDVEQQGWEEGVDRWKATLSSSASQSLLDELRAAREVVLNAQSWSMARGMMLGTRGTEAADEFVSAEQALLAALARYEKGVKR